MEHAVVSRIRRASGMGELAGVEGESAGPGGIRAAVETALEELEPPLGIEWRQSQAQEWGGGELEGGIAEPGPGDEKKVSVAPAGARLSFKGLAVHEHLDGGLYVIRGNRHTFLSSVRNPSDPVERGEVRTDPSTGQIISTLNGEDVVISDDASASASELDGSNGLFLLNGQLFVGDNPVLIDGHTVAQVGARLCLIVEYGGEAGMYGLRAGLKEEVADYEVEWGSGGLRLTTTGVRLERGKLVTEGEPEPSPWARAAEGYLTHRGTEVSYPVLIKGGREFRRIWVGGDKVLSVAFGSKRRYFASDSATVTLDDLADQADGRAGPGRTVTLVWAVEDEDIRLVRDGAAADGVCQDCDEDLKPLMALSRMARCGHVLHTSCATGLACPCGTGGNIEKTVGVDDIVVTDRLVVVGHGRMEGTTFAPVGMDVHTFVPEGRDMLMSAGYLVAADRRGDLKAARTFPSGSQSVPNVKIFPLSNSEMLAYYQVIPEGVSGIMLWPSEQALCPTPELCRGLHLCDGILGKLRGVKELRIIACLGQSAGNIEMPGDRYRGRGIELKMPGAPDGTLDDIVDEAEEIWRLAEKDLTKALDKIDDYPVVTQTAVLGAMPGGLDEWVTAARRADACQQYLPESLQNRFPREYVTWFNSDRWQEALKYANECIVAEDQGQNRTASNIRRRCEAKDPFYYAMFQKELDERRNRDLMKMLAGLTPRHPEQKEASVPGEHDSAPRDPEEKRLVDSSKAGAAARRAMATARTDLKGTLAAIDRSGASQSLPLRKGWLAAARRLQMIQRHLPAHLQNRFDEKDISLVSDALWAETGAFARSWAAAGPNSQSRQNLTDISRAEDNPYFFAMFMKQIEER
ncbi:hypothetical protein [Streptomyces sp. NPDC055085]